MTDTTEATQVTETQEHQMLFQAVGIIPGKVTLSSDGKAATIVVNKQNYPLLYIPSRNGIKAWDALKKQIENTGDNNLRLIVYPRVIHFPKKEQPHQVAFQLVGFDRGNKDGICGDLNDFEFKISGLWQFIPVCSVPCISVFRNFSPDRLEYVKQKEAYKQASYMKSNHIPIFWKDAPVKPFRFNPKAPKEQQGHQLFVSVKAKFLPIKNVFGFETLLALPSSAAPKFFKVGKKLKAEVLAAKKEFMANNKPKPEVSDQKPKPKPKIVAKK